MMNHVMVADWEAPHIEQQAKEELSHSSTMLPQPSHEVKNV